MFKIILRGLALLLPWGCGAMLCAAQPASAAVYVDNSLGEVPSTDIHKIATPKPTQLLFEFQTDGASNPKATKYAKPIVTEEVKASGFASEVSEGAVLDGARLSIVMNNITQKNAASKGFLTGLTLGLAGTVVADDYDVLLSYVSADGQAPITRTVHHRLYMKIGAKASPPNATPVKKIDEAVRMIIHQVVTHGLNDIAGDTAFAAATASTIESGVR